MPAIAKNRKKTTKKTTNPEIVLANLSVEERQANLVKYAIRATSKKFNIKGLRAEGNFERTREDTDPDVVAPHYKITVTINIRAKDPEFKFASASVRNDFETLFRQNVMALGKWMVRPVDRMVITLTGFYDIEYDIPSMNHYFAGRGRFNDTVASIGRSSFTMGNEIASAGGWGIC
ncbi:hypothetical protein EPVG_00338 [Emiliania huxleyi virus 201]|nr:hypothetical protein EPVG_00338 [Emiliania huxleyi virus 201]